MPDGISVERAWINRALPERVKRLPLFGYRYQALGAFGREWSFAAWPLVDPAVSRQGLGRRLLAAAIEAVAAARRDVLLLKARADEASFFEACSFKRLPASVSPRDSELRYWRAKEIGR